MPFQSEAQRRYLWANEPEIARDWTETYGSRIQKKNGGIMSIQGGVENYEPSEMVNVPRKAKSSPDHPSAHLAYITDKEQDLLVKMNLYGSLKGKPNRGPAGIPSLQGDFGGGSYGGHEGADVSGSKDTGTGSYGKSSKPADIAAQKAFDASFGITGSKPKGFLSNVWDAYKTISPTYNLFQLGKKAFTPQTPQQKLQANINKGYDVNNPAEMHGAETRTGPTSGPDRGDGQVPPQYIDDVYAQNVMEEDGLDIDTSTGNMDDWVQNFRLADAYRQQPGTIDKPITYT